MGDALFRVLQPGPFTLLVGLPHPGRQRYGVPPGGAMDPISLRIANLLARNSANAFALEIALAGPTLEIMTDCTLALAGADLGVTLDGQEVGNWRAFHAAAGATLKCRSLRHGARAYLAVAGELALDRENTIPPISPRLAKGDVLLRAGKTALTRQPLMHLPKAEHLVFADPAQLRVLPGPHWNRFSAEAHTTLVSKEYEVSHESNRVGIRLKGEPLAFAADAKADIISEPTPLGTLQVPASGVPILLMADRPTTGGYAKIATVISADIGLAGQLAPGNRVRFVMTTLSEAQSAAQDLEARLSLMEQMATWPH